MNTIKDEILNRWVIIFFVIGIFVGILISATSLSPKSEPEIDSFLYNGIYGWFCYDDSSYEPAISDVKQQFIDRKCHLISIENTTINRSYYIENGWINNETYNYTKENRNRCALLIPDNHYLLRMVIVIWNNGRIRLQ